MDRSREELLEKFASMMRRRLQANVRQGSWREQDSSWLFARALSNLADANLLLTQAGDEWSARAVEQLADAANYLAMLADRLGCLEG